MALPHRRPARNDAIQLCSPFFKLPAEIRVAIYELLDYPPIDNSQCRGLVLSCRQAKDECDGIAARKSKTWLATFQQTALLPHRIRLLLPRPKPIGSRFKLNTIRELTVVFPSSMVDNGNVLSHQFWDTMRHLNPIFGLWLDKLTLHFSASETFSMNGIWIMRCFRQVWFILYNGFTYAHDPEGQKRHKEICKNSSKWDIWMPEPVFMREIVVAWALPGDEGEMTDMVAVDGVCRKCPTLDCVGSRSYRVSNESGLHGEMMKASSCRFRPSAKERRFARPSSEHKDVCFSCAGAWDYQRYMRPLPEEGDDRWVGFEDVLGR